MFNMRRTRVPCAGGHCHLGRIYGSHFRSGGGGVWPELEEAAGGLSGKLSGSSARALRPESVLAVLDGGSGRERELVGGGRGGAPARELLGIPASPHSVGRGEPQLEVAGGHAGLWDDALFVLPAESLCHVAQGLRGGL
eukprot:scaffold2191_cov254-Pinguiococcus_pyrenoidosus.AAC.26